LFVFLKFLLFLCMVFVFFSFHHFGFKLCHCLCLVLWELPTTIELSYNFESLLWVVVALNAIASISSPSSLLLVHFNYFEFNFVVVILCFPLFTSASFGALKLWTLILNFFLGVFFILFFSISVIYYLFILIFVVYFVLFVFHCSFDVLKIFLSFLFLCDYRNFQILKSKLLTCLFFFYKIYPTRILTFPFHTHYQNIFSNFLHNEKTR
jgi:hypothetical protein